MRFAILEYVANYVYKQYPTTLSIVNTQIGVAMRPKRGLRLGIRISEEERRALDWLAAERDVPISLIVRHSLKRVLQEAGAGVAQDR